MPAKKIIKIVGERLSGTNYLNILIKKNFINVEWINQPMSNIEDLHKNHKHFIKDLSTTSPNVLHIVIFRNVYDWIRSLYNKKYHLSKMLKATFSEFIRMEAESFYNLDQKKISETCTVEKFTNLLEMRKHKMRTWLESGSKTAEFISYDELQKNQSILMTIAKKHNISTFFPYIINETRRTNDMGGVENIFIKKTYPSISDEDMRFINENVDWELEARFGFSKIDKL